ncbi:ROK family protein [Peribacillus sp. SCS-26]|uniref:ROK family protein n=1 Tax=Paraperibacillus marinus TaxID=3115295 RepID=UPI003906C1AB
MDYTLAVDIGGTKIAAGIFDSTGSRTARFTAPSDVSSEENMYTSLLSGIDQTLHLAGLDKADIKRMGVAMPGQVDTANGVAVYQNNLPWRNYPLGDRLRGEFPDALLAFEHDVAAAAIGEHSVRADGGTLFVYITISTGIAATILYEGKPIRGGGLAGEVGLFPVEGGTLETYASGSAMERHAAAAFNIPSLAGAASEWKRGNPELHSFFQSRAYQLALAAFQMTCTLDPNILVFGGGVINHSPEFFQLIQDEYAALCTHPLQKNWPGRLECSLLKEDSGLAGAAIKARNQTAVKGLAGFHPE